MPRLRQVASCLRRCESRGLRQSPPGRCSSTTARVVPFARPTRTAARAAGAAATVRGVSATLSDGRRHPRHDGLHGFRHRLRRCESALRHPCLRALRGSRCAPAVHCNAAMPDADAILALAGRLYRPRSSASIGSMIANASGTTCVHQEPSRACGTAMSCGGYSALRPMTNSLFHWVVSRNITPA